MDSVTRWARRSVWFWVLAFGGFVWGPWGVLQASPGADGGRDVLDLSGLAWQMEGIRPGQGVKEGFYQFSGPSTYNWNGARVPGDVYTDLWRAGEIDDPHYGRNGMRAKWVMEKEWWYRRHFAVPSSWRGRTIRVCFDGVDYACEVWLNGTYLGGHEGMFSPFEFEVDSVLDYGPNKRANCLAVKLEPPPRIYRNVAGRKFAWHGDYWRAITPMGIWKPVRLVATGPVWVEDVYPVSRINGDGSADVDVQVELADRRNEAPGGTRSGPIRVECVIRGRRFEAGPYAGRATASMSGATGRATVAVHIPDVRLWWPWDLGTPHLYAVETRVVDAQGRVLDRVAKTFGVREIRAERNPGYTEQEVQYPWTIVINGKRTFLRSANWGGPPDIFYGRNTPEKYRTLVHLAREANINNLRIFGWHPPEVEPFYALCDELGITVWQDLIPLASVSLPEDEAFREATYAEAVAVIKTLRTHPSLVLLEGGEEVFYAGRGYAYNAKFLLGLEKAIRPYTDLPYIPTSPLNWPRVLRELGLGGPKDSAHTHELFYAMGRRLLEDYVATWDYAAIPEFAVSSAPCVESIRRFIPPAEVWPPGPSWGYHWADLDVFRALNFQIFGDERMDSVESFVEATQVAQGTIFQWGIEHMRRRKPKSSAISICHFITWAPDMKWGIVDYYQVPKRSYEFVKRAYQPLLVSLAIPKRRWQPGQTFTAEVWLVNDFHREFRDCTLRVVVEDTHGQRLYEQTYPVDRIAGDSSRQHSQMTWTVAEHLADGFDVRVKLTDRAGRELSANQYRMLIGDQDQARRRCRELSDRFAAEREPYPTADYYRFFPELGSPNPSP